MIIEEQPVISPAFRCAVISAAIGFAPLPALAQDNSSQKSFEVSSLHLADLPIPTSREKALGETVETKTAPKIRRTSSGIRMVGPVFFPEDRNK